ncbi:hypothetical protein BOH66_12870 [Microbacterium aurum]|uniref:Polysaccharide pyruvyl transferase domain-containing protein n=1 Tax=Microbacterium aurum TaxID=36805 RepID=A0A1P8UAD0_9MICO|nr:polysaccharide pyruvyl transferase family protein [Microbacterium aurum]APZ35035.1 hypothetical protein BOH66_12870 [Microbacterium aurum]MBM7828985.1 hypothetical protein [Microbacterium aurum]
MLHRRRAPARPYYLVSAAGLPNYGDEILTRVWLDWLAKNRPNTPVWLDCPEPGRANHLFADAHPLLRTTNTLWHLAFSSKGLELNEAASRAEQLVSSLGSPRFDLGLLDLRQMQSVHLLGGGYLNSIWPEHLALLPAVVTLKKLFGVPAFATGQGLMPLDDEARQRVSEWANAFDVFETRDEASAAAVGVGAGFDDAFLAFANDRMLYSNEDAPEVMLVIQGDFMSPDAAEDTVDAVEAFVRRRAKGHRVGLIESIPPDDAWILHRLGERGIDVEFYPFSRIWKEGLPARAGQEWLTTRFHFHLLAAAVGAHGAAIELHPEYYAVKHGSLRSLGTGWAQPSIADAGNVVPAASKAFAHTVRELSRRKASLARSLYPR